ncbi:LLM class flavin-dependent oxidoreductase [Streptomyces sp. NBC_00287]|uniref:LLM class flavin-dependent oxidoreductase n=1 Tax=Streptomyces sp. NBC_00287 TaxID=2975702 RepID=UPI002E2B4030|nr:LLM class flavin-dependent oxidoreductase [Streptomyces sp. NBC_00287]
MATSTLTSIMYPVMPTDIGQVLPVARLLQRRGAGRLWAGQSLRLDTHQIFAALAGMGVRVPMGSGVTLAPLRHPYDAAVQARSVAALSGFPYVAGIGPATPDFQRALLGSAYRKPLTAMREYVTVMRGLLQGEVVRHEGEYHSLEAEMFALAAPEVEIGLGVLRPRMARMAGAVADVAVTWMTPAGYIGDSLLPALADGAAEAGRKAPRVATVVHVAVARPGRDIRLAARAGAGAHLRADHYTDMLRRGGVEAYPDDPDAGADALVEAGVFVAGTPDEIAAELDRYRDSGVDEVVLNPAGVLNTEGLGAGVRDLQDILAAVDRRHG